MRSRHSQPLPTFRASFPRTRRGKWDVQVLVGVLVAAVLLGVVLPLTIIRRSRQAASKPSVDTRVLPGVSSTEVHRLPSAAPALSERERRMRLESSAEMLKRDLEMAGRFSRSRDVVVQADFVLGDDRWTMRSATAGDVTTSPSLFIMSPKMAGEVAWRFLSAADRAGNAAAPHFVFFPDGTAQGGAVEMGSDDLRVRVSLTTAGVPSVQFVKP